MMIWYTVSSLLFVIAAAVLVYSFLQDRKLMRSKTSETMSEEIKKELDEELNVALEKQKKFKAILTDVTQKKEQHG